MKIARVEHLHADAGQRNFDFLKITTDDGLVGWSEYNESFGGLGVSAVIDGLAPLIVGKDPRAHEAIVTLLYAVRRQASGGVVQQAIGAIENALLDVKARALGLPVYALLGGPVRDRIRLYWSHCGTYRLAWSGPMQIPALKTLQDVVNAGKEFYGHLATFMNAHFCAVVPNLRIMEIDPDVVPWYSELVTVKPRIEAGHLLLPTGPGWGTEVDEEAVRAHPPRKR
jgi:L-alanine-DL-glutamate epimerase-like enolase superfamily enzyme